MELIDLEGLLYLKGLSEKATHLKDINGKWDRVQNAWRFYPFYFIVEHLQTLYGDSLKITSPLAQEMIKEEWGFTEQELNIPELVKPFFDRLYDYQKIGVKYLLSHPYGAALLGFTPRLGKTPTSIVAAQLTPHPKQILVVCPKILIPNWVQEWGVWSPEVIDVVSTHQSIPDTDVVVNVTNYETIVKYQKEYEDVQWDVVIVDESLMIKNYRTRNSPKTSQRAAAVASLNGSNCYFWELSGGPISNHADDLHGQFKAMYPKIFSSYWKFAEHNCFIERSTFSTAGRYGGKVTATRPQVNIRNRYKDVMFIRNMEEVLENVPSHIVQNVFLEMEPKQKKIYEKAVGNLLVEVEKTEITTIDMIFNHLESAIRLQQAFSNPVNFGSNDVSIKTDYVINALDNNEVELPVLIWCHWRKGLNSLYNHLKKKFPNLRIAKIMGGTEDSGQIALDYKDGKYDILIVSVTAGKYGLNLSNTRTIFSYDRIWDGDAMFQSTFRSIAPQMTHRPVWINLVVKDSADYGIFVTLDPKFSSIENVMGLTIKEFLRL